MPQKNLGADCRALKANVSSEIFRLLYRLGFLTYRMSQFRLKVNLLGWCTYCSHLVNFWAKSRQLSGSRQTVTKAVTYDDGPKMKRDA